MKCIDTGARLRAGAWRGASLMTNVTMVAWPRTLT